MFNCYYKLMKVKLLILSSLVIFFVLIMRVETERRISINYEVSEYKIPIYLKLLDFMNRHYNYKHLAKNINNKNSTDKDKIINSTNWVIANIEKINLNQNIDIVDHHPITIVERRLGIDEQFSDILSVLLVYSNIDSFFKIIKLDNVDSYYPLTFFKIYNYWSIVDPQNGIFFLDENNNFINIDNLKKQKFNLVDKNLKIINHDNFLEYFDNNFKDFNEIKFFYNQLFVNIPSTNQINSINKFYRGGRSYTQDPLGRINYELLKMYNKLIN